MATDRALTTTGDAVFAAQIGATQPLTVAAQRAQRKVTRLVAADAASATTGIFKIATFDRPVQVISATVTEEGTVASNTSNYATWTLIQDNSAASATTTVSVTSGVNSSTTPLTAEVAQTMGISTTAAQAQISSGYSLYAQLAKAGAGVTRPSTAVIDVIYQEI